MQYKVHYLSGGKFNSILWLSIAGKRKKKERRREEQHKQEELQMQHFNVASF